MQFVSNGPDIPETLLRAHEDGRVIFFCGAGISYPAGLPGFGGLVKKIYDSLGTHPADIEKAALARDQFDAALDQLERRHPGQRIAVRAALAKILSPNLRKKGATTTHSSLLTLGTSRHGGVRLITTNFDRLFEKVIRREKLTIQRYPAPLLPIPKNSRWNGLVYLHGLLPEKYDESALQRLVLSSGDFGLAYLTERWAARFVSELFRNYTVCFVGYSINDPVLRYMMDALAADKLQGETAPQAYAFGEYAPGAEKQKEVEWAAKGVTPILYEAPSLVDHSALHKTLKAWADTYRDGVNGKEQIIVQYAAIQPVASTKQDDFVGRMLWALCHEDGLPARRFADFNPVPSIEWLDPLCENRYRHADLERFGVPALAKADPDLTFSITRRPASYLLAPWMTLFTANERASGWDPVMFQLARWLTRHLDDPKLLWWISRRGADLHFHFARLIERAIAQIEAWERDGNTAELNTLRASAPKAIPRPFIRTIWRLIISGHVKQSANRDIFQWRERFHRYGLTPSIQLELRELLAPRVALRPPIEWPSDQPETTERSPINWEIALCGEHINYSLKELNKVPEWRAALSQLIDDFQQLLHDALGLMRELGGATETSDSSFWDLPSISPHWQNRGYRDWVTLIELLRDAWLSLATEDALRARAIAEKWWGFAFPTFKRLALFAASNDHTAIAPSWVDWLLENQGWALWSVETQREMFRLLVLKVGTAGPESRAKLEHAIVSGPPQAMFREDIGDERFVEHADRMMWLRLAKLQAGGAPLGREAETKLRELSAAHPKWELAPNERDEFSHWMSGTGDPDYEVEHQIETAPRNFNDLVKWLGTPTSTNRWQEDDWRDVLRARFGLALRALIRLASTGNWPSDRWRTAFQVWSEGRRPKRSWCFLKGALREVPEKFLLEVAHSIGPWLGSVAKAHPVQEEGFFNLCTRILELPYDDKATESDAVTEAINHPVGHVTEALIGAWFAQKPQDKARLPTEFRQLFTRLCDMRVTVFRHARVILAAHVIALFRVDPAWTADNLLPLFEWERNPQEALAVWKGFLWAARLYRPLISTIKVPFLQTASHYSDLGDAGRQYVALLAYSALDRGDTFKWAELATATSILPSEALEETASALALALEGAGEQRAEYWTNRIRPYWHAVWPKARVLISAKISLNLGRLIVAAGSAFPDALRILQDWIVPSEQSHFIVSLLSKTDLCKRYPREALQLLCQIIGADDPWPAPELAQQLNEIAIAWPAAREDDCFRRLENQLRRQA